jgi:hypothetical protein
VEQRPRHPEVDQENATATKPKNQILAAPFDGVDDLALKLDGDLVRIERPRDPRIGDLDTLEPPPHERRLQARANRLDLGELRHGASLAASQRA